VNRELLDRLGLLTEEDVAAVRGVAIESLRNERGRGEGPPFMKWGAATFYRIDALKAWAAEQEQSGSRDQKRGAAHTVAA
jgi:hypothetical protein